MFFSQNEPFDACPKPSNIIMSNHLKLGSVNKTVADSATKMHQIFMTKIVPKHTAKVSAFL